MTLIYVKPSIHHLFVVSIMFSIIITCSYAAYDPKANSITLCSSPSERMASVESKPYTQSVSIPVGSNTNELPKWSNSSSWKNGIKPTTNDEILIPKNSVLVLDQNINVKSIKVNGKLIVDISKDISITTELIMVMGNGAYFEWGTTSEKYAKNGEINLIGDDINAKIPGTNVESKAIAVMNGGRLEMHAVLKSRWTYLNETAKAGDTKITLSENPNWHSGDQIIIASTGIEAIEAGRNANSSQTEKVTIKSVQGNMVTLNTPLQYRHHGTIQTVSNGKGKTWTLDERAEVGNLTRNIKITGSKITSGSDKEKGFGGHVMIMHSGSVGNVSSVEFDNMGQSGILGRYPFHWHMVGDVTGQSIRDCAVHDANNRAITVHGTQNAIVEDNVIHNVLGHAIFLEDGNETGVIISRNLVAEVLKPKRSIQLLASDRFFQNNRIDGPAAIWLMNPDNDVTNNACVSSGTGIWYSLDSRPHGAASGQTNIVPNRTPMGAFQNNRAHGCYVGFNIDFVDIEGDTDRWKCNTTNYKHENDQLVESFTGFSNYRAVWFRGYRMIFDDFKMANNRGRGTWVPTFSGLLRNSLVMGHTENEVTSTDNRSYGVSIYDGILSVESTHFENFDGPKAAAFVYFSGAHKNFPSKVMPGVTFKNANIYHSPTQDNITGFEPFMSILEDREGTLTGRAGDWIVPRHPFIIDDSFEAFPNGHTYHGAKKFARLGVNFGGLERTPIYMDWGNGSPVHSSPAGSFTEFPVMVNSSRIHRMRFIKHFNATNTFHYEYGRTNDWVTFFIDGVPSEFNINNGSSEHRIDKVNSIGALNSATKSVSYYQNSTNRMYFRLKYNANATKFVLKTPGNDQITPVYKIPSEDLYRPFDNQFGTVGTLREAEHFDYGGLFHAYSETFEYDSKDRFAPGSFPFDGFLKVRQGEIVNMSLNGNNAILRRKSQGDYWKYSYNISETGTFPIKVKVQAKATIAIEIDGIEVLAKGINNNTLEEIDIGNIGLTVGKHIITIKLKSGDMEEFDWLLIGDVSNNTAPIVTIAEPTSFDLVEGYQSLYVLLNATDPDGDNMDATVYVNGIAIREEKNQPFEWGHNGSPDVNELTGLEKGTHELMVVVTDSKGLSTTITQQIDVIEVQGPFNGLPIVIPGIVEAEEYDKGGQGVSYNDSDAENRGAAQSNFRIDEGVDIGDALGIRAIGWTVTGEWTQYSVNVIESADYDFTIHYSSQNGGGQATLATDGSEILSVGFDATNAWDNYESLKINSIPLNSGEQVLRFTVVNKGFNIDKIEIEKSVVTAFDDVNQLEIVVFPNPSEHGIFHLSGARGYKVKDSLGNYVIEGEGTTIDLSQQPNGLYILEVDNQTMKIMR